MMIRNIIQNATLSRKDFIKAEVDKMNPSANDVKENRTKKSKCYLWNNFL